MAVPRWRDGVPSTLNTISVTISKKAQRNEKRLAPKLKPFPNLAANIVGDCKAMQNVAALEIDPRGWLWVADSGNSNMEIYTKRERKHCHLQKKKKVWSSVSFFSVVLYFHQLSVLQTPFQCQNHLFVCFNIFPTK